MDAREGQQSGLTTNAFEKVTPFATSSARTVGIAQSVSHRWSSVTMRTTLG
jgi:hypothetical protein